MVITSQGNIFGHRHVCGPEGGWLCRSLGATKLGASHHHRECASFGTAQGK